ncbi:TPM domain-containing protein [Microbacterium sp. bgisy189]|uniref:TPM domain-containing protein n=1 Tax=Microbacterium sp. bgisy189 TaxID=3413798 RepID=UPI003EB815B2
MRAPATRFLTTVVLAAGFALASAAPAVAAPPLDLDGEQVIDEAGVLSAAEVADIERAIDDLSSSTGTGLYVAIVDDFDDPSSGPSWADETAFESELGTDDMLLAIAVDDRNVAYSVDVDFALSNDRIDDVMSDSLIPRLRNGEWAAGVVDFAAALDEAQQPGPPWLLIIGGGTVGIIAGIFGIRWLSQRVARVKRARELEEELDALDERADGMLVDIDDAIRTGDQEVGFAAAQFGDAAAAPFREALERARRLVAEAFATQRDVQDDTLSPTRRRELLDAIIARCTEADALLDEQDAAFDALRDLERQAPELRGPLREHAQRAAAEVEAVTQVRADLQRRFGDAAVASVEGSAEQAGRLRSFALVELDRADAALAEGRSGIAAVSVRSAQQALGQLETLTTGIRSLAETLIAADARRTAAIADAESDISDARALVLDDAGHAARVRDAATAAERAIAEARVASPDAGVVAVETADAALGAVVADVVGAARLLDRAHAQYDRVRESAQAEVKRAALYIDTRRGVIGSRARTMLARANALLASAVASAAMSDLSSAFVSLQQASDEASRALTAARDDVARDDPLPAQHDGDDGAFLGGIFGFSSGSSGSSRASRSGWSSSSRSRSSSSSRRSSSRSSSSSRRSGGSRSSSRRSGGRRF